jgi:hypothetical protein
LPIVTRETDKLGLVAQYNQLAGKAAGFGLLKAEEANLAQYVTGKTLDGLFTTIGEQERALRRDPVGAARAAAKSVRGAEVSRRNRRFHRLPLRARSQGNRWPTAPAAAASSTTGSPHRHRMPST